MKSAMYDAAAEPRLKIMGVCSTLGEINYTEVTCAIRVRLLVACYCTLHSFFIILYQQFSMQFNQCGAR